MKNAYFFKEKEKPNNFFFSFSNAIIFNNLFQLKFEWIIKIIF